MDMHAGHELVVLLQHDEDINRMKGIIRQKFPAYDTKTWREIMPEIDLVEGNMDFLMYLFLAVILVALIFGIVNTMLMAILERIRELGMLMAVGMNKTRVFLMILLETVFLSLTGGIIGIIWGYLTMLFFNRKGIDLSKYAVAYEKLGYESIIYTVISFDICLKVTLMVLLAGILASIYPAWKAIQLKPAEALRIDI